MYIQKRDNEQFIKGEKILNEELQMKKKNGELIWINLTVNPKFGINGEVIERDSTTSPFMLPLNMV